MGAGLIWDGTGFETLVIPGKAGIHSANLRKGLPADSIPLSRE